MPKYDRNEISSQASNRSSDLLDSFTSNRQTIQNLNNTEKSTNESRNNSMTTKNKELSLLADVDNNQTNNDKNFQGIHQVYYIITHWIISLFNHYQFADLIILYYN